MEVRVISESNYEEALFGFGFSFGLTENMTFEEFCENEEVFDKVQKAATKRAGLMGGHDKFLRAILVNVDVKAPFFWLKQVDAYNVGIVCQSASTMHTLHKRGNLTNLDFEYGEEIPGEYLAYINRAPNNTVKYSLLPSGFLQRRLYTLNYAVLGNFIWKRYKHKLPQWQFFCGQILQQVSYPELLQRFVDNAE